MKIVAFSDTHGIASPQVEKCDVVCICGDIVPLRMQRNIPQSLSWLKNEFIPWCMDLPCKKVILIAGNHDFVFHNEAIAYLDDGENIIDNGVESFSRALEFPDKIVYLQDREYKFEGVTFYGTPWCPDLWNWAFYGDHDELVTIFSKIPEKADVLLTHTPGSSCNGTETSHFAGGVEKNFGCSELTEAVYRRNIGMWICGHIHSGNHVPSNLDNDANTVVVNVSSVDERYFDAYDPIVLYV